MTRDLALDDPEVRADIAHREASRRDSTRSSLVDCDECGCHVKAHDLASGQCNTPACDCQEFQRGGGPTWSPPAIVERHPCAKSCGTIVDVPQEALDAFEAVNVLLGKRGQSVPKSKGFICDACKRRDDELVAALRRPHQQQHLGLAPGKGRP
ncbi:MAG: hypothetical protein ABR520_11155 [Mycobacteriales bacterium]|nr:hypothetical protein [Actinomycetota bacterium]